jgi:hypothetical protein
MGVVNSNHLKLSNATLYLYYKLIAPKLIVLENEDLLKGTSVVIDSEKLQP